jgi:ATP-dependent Lhr-like helicase
VDALWSLVWKGLCTNDTFRALRAFARGPAGPKQAGVRRRDRPLATGLPTGAAFRSRRSAPAAAEGRWSLVAERARARSARADDIRSGTLKGSQAPRDGTPAAKPPASHTERAAALAQQLLARYGLVTREVGAAEELPGGFSAVYEVLRTMEETGKIRRGYFVGGVAAMQFALPPVLEMLRGLRARPERPEVVTLLAVDPANPYGALLPWPGNASAAPDRDDSDGDSKRGRRTRGPTRTVGSYVILVDGALGAWVGRGGRQLYTFLPADEPDRGRVAEAVAAAVARLAGGDRRATGQLLAEIDDLPAARHPLADALAAVGFLPTYDGLQYRPPRDGHDGRSIRQSGRAGAS